VPKPNLKNKSRHTKFVYDMTKPCREFTYVTEEDILKVDFGVPLEVPKFRKFQDTP